MPIGDPTDIPGCTLWLSADSLSLSGGAPVSLWVNGGSGAGDATQLVGGRQPTYQTAQINGLPVVRFDGFSAEMEADIGSLAGSITATLFVVCSPANTDTGRCPLLVGNDAANNGYGIATSTSPNAKVGRLRAGVAWDDGSADAQTGPALYSLVQSSGLCVVYLNGVAVGIFGSNPNSPTTRVALGNHQYGVGYSFAWAGDLGEVIVYDSALSDSDREDVEAYLNGKWFGGGPPPSPPLTLIADWW